VAGGMVYDVWDILREFLSGLRALKPKNLKKPKRLKNPKKTKNLITFFLKT